MSQKPKVLYFLRGAHPSESNLKKADSFGGGVQVCFRNANFHKPGDTLEECDGVCGFPPKEYAQKYPAAKPGEVGRQSEQEEKTEDVKAAGEAPKGGEDKAASSATNTKVKPATPANKAKE